ncbi:hypothetical protein E6B08_01505 [Pseudomonas putida]|uniref:Dermonecrotic toxin N-terminal domain-containing protein n=1 Tax=Pseudomonas putida TaxID=303 RepID=A0A4D6X2Q8_PSEPU|nr:DUF6543 domain-containing protein [Pseudomonas putida]QCI10183.1 hypothetical protein E6B08_01505 [Pseudomonas putida]
MSTPTIALAPLPLLDADTTDGHLAGKGNLLVVARQTQTRSAAHLRTLLSQAPSLRQTLLTTLRDHLQVDPSSCGLQHDQSQVTLLTFAARLLVSPVSANAFAEWSGWGFSETHANWSVAQWTQYLTPIVAAARLRAPLDYWQGRMPGTAISRQRHASDLLREHFDSSLDIAYGVATLQTDGWRQGKQTVLPCAHLAWRQPDNRVLVSTSALLIGPPPERSRWLLYQPAARHPVLEFANLDSLRDWSFQNRSSLWSDPKSSVAQGTRDDVVITPFDGDGFAALVAHILSRNDAMTDHHLLKASQQGDTDPLDWTDLQAWEAQRSAAVSASLDATHEVAIDGVIAADAELAQQEVHFACLEQHLPISWRNQQVEYQEMLLEQHLNGDQEPTSDTLTQLREQQAALEQLQDSQELYLLELPDEVSSTDWQAITGEHTREAQITDGLCQALLKEARLRHLLGELSDAHLQWIERLVDRPEPSLQRPVQACSLELVAGDHTWQLCGYMTLHAIPDQDDEDPDRSVLLYRPGQRGGLMAFDDASALDARLLATLQGAWPDALLESASPHDAAQLFDILASASQVTFKRVPIDTHFMLHCVRSIVTALPAPASRQQARQRLCIAENRARALAVARFAEKNRTEHLQTRMMSLQHLEAEQITELAGLIQTLEGALQASGDLLKLSLPDRKAYARLKLLNHLRSAFNLEQVPRISLDIADSVTLQKTVTGQSAAGGAGSRDVPVFSKERSEVDLETFILWALDSDRSLRLNDATIKVEPANSVLQEAVTTDYIANLIEQLDVAGNYEKRITATYLGFAHESAWQAQWRQETLRRPYACRLQLLAQIKPSNLDADGQRLLETFCREQLDPDARRTIAHHAVELRPGVAADGSSDRIGLSGVHIIQGPTGPSLLYLPEAPSGQVIGQYANASEACLALQNMALDDAMARYLASQAQEGNPQHHLGYIKTALQKGFHGFIEIGVARPESLPTYETRLDMGQRIRAHRASSRSQADLSLVTPDNFDRYFFLMLRLALGITPGVGTALALYDGWNAATTAVKAFGSGNTEEGLQQLTSVLQSLTDAVLTLAPLASTANAPALSARQLTQHRQRLDPLRSVGSIRKSPPSPFAGYEVELPTGPMLRTKHRQGAQVFEHLDSQQHYITRNDAWYAVNWDTTYSTWRLKPQGTRTYPQPVRLSEHGRWETPGRLSGLLVDDGLAGGGGVLTRLYEHGVAYWRTTLGRQPRPLTGMRLAHDINDELKRIRSRMAAKELAYTTAKRQVADLDQMNDRQRAAIAKARQELNEELNRSLEFNTLSLARLREQRSTLLPTRYTDFTTQCDININELHLLDMKLVSERFIMATDQVTRAGEAIRALHGQLVAAELVQRLTAASLRANIEMVDALQEVERISIRHHTRLGQLQGAIRTQYTEGVAQTNLTLDVTNARLVRASILSTTLFTSHATQHAQMGTFMGHFLEQGRTLRSMLYSQIQLPSAGLSGAQRRRFLLNARDRYRVFLSHLTAWEDTFHELLSPTETRAFRRLMHQLISQIDDTLNNVPAPRQRNPASGNLNRPRLFETVEGPLIGTEVFEGGQPRMRINEPHSNRAHSIYARNAAGQWQLTGQQHAAPTQTIAELVDTATARLNDLARQQARLRQYQTPQTLPVDLEDIAQGHAQQLRFIAASIRQRAGDGITAQHTALISRLDTAAEQMGTLGRQLRIAQTKATSKPTVGYLEYLVEQGEVEVAWSRTLKPKVDRRNKPIEYLEEYRIDDAATQQPLWYAHFHFRTKPAQGFNRLEAGHLKLPSERDLGAGAWRGALNERQATRLFGNLRPASR